jgi:4-nitrophenyl phosphatase
VDGVVWLSGTPLPGAAEGLELLRSAGFEVWFVTNNSSMTHESLDLRFSRAGIETAGRLLTSSDAAATMVRAGDSVLVGGEDGVVEALRVRGCDTVRIEEAVSGSDRGWFDAVVVGIHRSFDYGGLSAMSRHVRAGSRFIATNDDPSYPSPEGLLPGGGSIVAAVASAAGRPAEVAGKPHPAMVSVLRERLGGASPSWVIGDRASTDGAFAAALGARFVHVSSDVEDDAEHVVRTTVPSLLDAAVAIVASGTADPL